MKYNCYMIGEQPPYLDTTKACFPRLGEALIRTGSTLQGSYCMGRHYYKGRQSFIASVDVPEGKEEEFQSICKCTLSKHMSIQLGFEIIAPKHSYEGV